MICSREVTYKALLRLAKRDLGRLFFAFLPRHSRRGHCTLIAKDGTDAIKSNNMLYMAGCQGAAGRGTARNFPEQSVDFTSPWRGEF
jgi:hypothetical protein